MGNEPGWGVSIEGLSDLRRIVVVVPVHDERERLPVRLASIKAASARVDLPVTAVVVLDACTDDSARVVPSWVYTIRVSARNVGVARAAGFSAVASGAGADTWLASTDADSLVPPKWLLRQQIHSRAGAHGVVGTVCVDWQHHTRATNVFRFSACAVLPMVTARSARALRSSPDVRTLA
jgi:glycosyltransferase involved in cell wall biosynthesis